VSPSFALPVRKSFLMLPRASFRQEAFLLHVFQATGHSKEQIEAHAKHHHVDASMRRLQSKEGLQEHRVVKDFIQWQEGYKVGGMASVLQDELLSCASR